MGREFQKETFLQEPAKKARKMVRPQLRANVRKIGLPLSERQRCWKQIVLQASNWGRFYDNVVSIRPRLSSEK